MFVSDFLVDGPKFVLGSVLIFAGFKVAIAFSNLKRDRADSVAIGSFENSRED